MHANHPTQLHRICVFCGSSMGSDPAFRDAATALGAEIAARGLALVYGGASVGLMGAVADAALAGGANVHGVLTRGLAARELAHPDLTRLDIVETMHERKTAMADLSDAFIAMPGGIGTLEELFEVWTWAQLGIHSKPVGLLNVAGYFDPLSGFLDHAVKSGFLRASHRDMTCRDHDPARLLDALAAAEPLKQPKWIEAGQR